MIAYLFPQFCTDRRSIGDAAANQTKPGAESIIRPSQHCSDYRLGSRMQREPELDHLGPRTLHRILDSLLQTIRIAIDEVASGKILLNDGVWELQPDRALYLEDSVGLELLKQSFRF